MSHINLKQGYMSGTAEEDWCDDWRDLEYPMDIKVHESEIKDAVVWGTDTEDDPDMTLLMLHGGRYLLVHTTQTNPPIHYVLGDNGWVRANELTQGQLEEFKVGGRNYKK